jgi:site-specific recombinase XerD
MSNTTLYAQLSSYLPAVVRNSPKSGMYIEYYIYNPMLDKMERHRLRCRRLVKRYRTRREQLSAAQALADELNRKLSSGWSPIHETEDARLYTPISVLRDKFIAFKKAEGVRPATMTTYTHHVDKFVRWCEDTGRAKKYSGTFLKIDAVSYMDYVLEQGNSNRHYDNTIKNMRVFFSWALEHCFCKENPFSMVKPLPKEKKRRILIDAATRKRITAYCETNCPHYLIVLKLVYYSAMRPKEISNIQLKHINIQRHYILVPEESAKNKKSRCATITKDLVDALLPIMKKYPNGDTYLFGSREGCLPSEQRVSMARFRKKWDELRENLSLPKEMQLYSLRDTGITDLLHAGIDQLTVQHHADHSSLAIQQIYTDHYDPNLNQTIYDKAPEF